MDYLSTLNYGYRLLKSKNILSYRLDSELLLSKALNKTREHILTNLNFTIKQNDFHKFRRLLLRRKRKEEKATEVCVCELKKQQQGDGLYASSLRQEKQKNKARASSPSSDF